MPLSQHPQEAEWNRKEEEGKEQDEYAWLNDPEEQEEGKQRTQGYEGDDEGDMSANQDPGDEGEGEGEKGCSETFQP